MNTFINRRTWLRWAAALGLALMCCGAQAFAQEMKLEALLIWGTNDDKSPNPEHKPVSADLEKRLKKLPFKWKNYFVVNSKEFSAIKGETTKVKMSEDCEILVRNPSDENVELSLVGKGKEVSNIKQSLPKGELLVTGGNVSGGEENNRTAWFVVLRQVK